MTNPYPDVLYVNVTQDDIDRGMQAVCAQCPLARAVHRVFSPLSLVLVGYYCTVWNSFTGPGQVYELEPAVHAWIKIYDEMGRRYVRPFSAILRKEQHNQNN
jgi:hypothetical protein